MSYQRITEDQLDVLNIIELDPNVSQRQIAQKTGLSIGKVNYCFKALIDIGFIKVENFTKSAQKLKCAYFLTQKGMQEKADITKQFIIKNKQEYDKLIGYIE